MIETSSHDHHHHHHHHHHAPHPYAEPSSPRPLLPSTPEEEEDGSAKKEEDEEEAELATLPSRLDRLIAFLDSYFGSVELLKSSAKETHPEAATETSATATSAQSAAEPTGAPEEEAVAQIDASEPAEKSEQEAVKIEAAAAEERANEIERERKHPRAPVIRVKLDEHFADVDIESLVRFFFFFELSFSKEELTTTFLRCQVVVSDYVPLQRRVESVVQIAMAIVTPLASIGDLGTGKKGGLSLLEHQDKKVKEVEA